MEEAAAEDAYCARHRAAIEAMLSKAVDAAFRARPREPLAFIASVLLSPPPADVAAPRGAAPRGPAKGRKGDAAGAALEELIRAPLERFTHRLARLVDEELRPLLDGLAAAFEPAAGASQQPGPDANASPRAASPAALPVELKVACVADVCNRAYEALRAPLLKAAAQNGELIRIVGEEAMGELKLANSVAAAAHSKVECGVQWTAPAAVCDWTRFPLHAATEPCPRLASRICRPPLPVRRVPRCGPRRL